MHILRTSNREGSGGHGVRGAPQTRLRYLRGLSGVAICLSSTLFCGFCPNPKVANLHRRYPTPSMPHFKRRRRGRRARPRRRRRFRGRRMRRTRRMVLDPERKNSDLTVGPVAVDWFG